MAKKDQSGEMPEMTDDTIDLLKKANGGKACRFVVACKASKPVLVICAKKGEPNKLIKAAKDEFAEAGASTGGITYCCGTVKKNDEGVLAFQIPAGNDWKVGDTPVQDAALAKYLKDGGLPPVDARMLVVASVEVVLDPSDPLVARFFKIRDTALELAKTQPDHATDLRDRVSQIEKTLDADSASDAAMRQIQELEARVREIMTGGTATTSAPVAPASGQRPAPPGPDSPLGKFQARLAQLIKQATPFLPVIGTQLKTLATQARELASASKIEDATKLLLQIGELIKNAATASAPATTAGSQGMDDFKTRLVEVKSLLEQAKTRLGDAGKLLLSEAGALMRKSAEFAQRGDFEAAMEGLASVAEKLGLSTSAPVAPTSTEQVAPKPKISELVAYRQALLRFHEAKGIVAAQVEELRKAIPAATGEAAIAEEMAELLDEYYTELGDAIDEAMVAAEDEIEPVTKDIRTKIDLFLADLGENALIKHLDNNPYEVKVSIETTLTTALNQIRATMPA